MENNTLDERFAKFIAKHHVLTVATVGSEGVPYVANCFYAYDRKRNLFIFTSDMATRHAQEMASEPRVRDARSRACAGLAGAGRSRAW